MYFLARQTNIDYPRVIYFRDNVKREEIYLPGHLQPVRSECEANRQNWDYSHPPLLLSRQRHLLTFIRSCRNISNLLSPQLIVFRQLISRAPFTIAAKLRSTIEPLDVSNTIYKIMKLLCIFSHIDFFDTGDLLRNMWTKMNKFLSEVTFCFLSQTRKHTHQAACVEVTFLSLNRRKVTIQIYLDPKDRIIYLLLFVSRTQNVVKENEKGLNIK